ncbi:GNAT family N-acetyltransferase [Nostoc sp. CHAB 5834]|nr:GNAT family N-acetyltransferase [Nostoc sp. CHAB 5834]
MKHGFFKLSHSDIPLVVGHLLSLPLPDRRKRFNTSLSDSSLIRWASSIELGNSWGYFWHGVLYGFGQVASCGAGSVEFAISVDPKVRGLGIAKQLLQLAIEDNPGRTVTLTHSTDNISMSKVYSAYRPSRSRKDGDFQVDIDTDVELNHVMKAHAILCCDEQA